MKHASPGTTIMFFNKNDHGLVKHLHIVKAAPFGAFTLKMNNGCFRQVVILIACLLYPVAEVHVLTIHKESLVKATYLLKHFFLCHQISTSQHIYFVILLFVQVPQMIPAKNF